MTVEQLAALLEERIPASLSEPWDHDGRMVIPNGDTTVTRVLCTLDCTTEAVKAAKALGCNVILTHHPLLFHPLETLSDRDSVGKRVLACVKAGIAVLSYHTRLDCMDGGVNDCLACAVGLQNARAFLPYARIGEVEEQPFADFCELVRNRLKARSIVSVCCTDTVKRVAVLSGSGKGEIAAVRQAGADTFVTGEVTHNDLVDCRELGLNLIAATHHATEHIVLTPLLYIVRSFGIPADIWDHDPLIDPQDVSH